MIEPRVGSVRLAGRELTTSTWGEDRPGIVLLHDGLGSIAQWRDVPAMLATATGSTVLAYDRAGHGNSTPVPDGAWPTDWLHIEAQVLGELLAELELGRPVLVGHSDGGSIALLHSAEPDAAVSGVVALAPHSFVEGVCVEAIAAMRAAPAAIVAGLARHHARPVAVFEAWSGVWTSAEFRTWDVRDRLWAVSVPTLIVQGRGDAYATEAQATTTASAVGAKADYVLVDGAGHLLHHDDPDRIVQLIADFVARLPP